METNISNGFRSGILQPSPRGAKKNSPILLSSRSPRPLLQPTTASFQANYTGRALIRHQTSLQTVRCRRIRPCAYLPTETPSTNENTATATTVNTKTKSHLLTADEAQSLTKLNAGNVYDLGIVRNSTELASSLATDTSLGILSSSRQLLQQSLSDQKPENYGAITPSSYTTTTTASTTHTILTLTERASRYGTNTVASPPSATFLELFLEALDDFTVKILLGAGAASLALEYWLAGNDGSSPNWIEGASILAAVAVVTLVTAGNNYQKEQQFKALQEIAAEEFVRALRNGREVQLSTLNVLVGDLVLVETGDILCADGVLVDGTDIKVDESHLTGEADDVAKDPIKAQALYSGSKVVSGFGRMIVTAVGKRSQSGAVAEMIAAAGEGRWAANHENASNTTATTTAATSELKYTTEGLGRLREETALQKKLVGYATVIGQLGLGAAILATAALATRFSYDTFLIAQLPWDWVYLHNYLNFFITGVTILVRLELLQFYFLKGFFRQLELTFFVSFLIEYLQVVAVPEGLPLAVTISLAYSVMKMLEENNLVRHLGAAETMATVTVICTDKTGTLTQNRMAVTRMWLAGQVIHDVGKYMSTQQPAPVLLGVTGGEEQPVGSATAVVAPAGDDDDDEKEAALWSMTFDDGDDALERLLCPELRQSVLGRVDESVLSLLCQSVTVNSTANVFIDRQGRFQESGNRTEIALLQLSRALQTTGQDETTTRVQKGAATVEENLLVQTPFTSERKRMSSLVALPSSSTSTATTTISSPSKHTSSFIDTNGDTTATTGRLFVKGAAEIILEHCTSRLNSQGQPIPFSPAEKTQLLDSFGGGGLRLLALAYRDVSLQHGREGSADKEALTVKDVEALEHELILISLVGLEDPLRPEAADAILKCQHAGISVKMLTGDNAGTAANIARAANILLPSTSSSSSSSLNGGGGGGGGGSFEVMEGQQFREMVVAADGSINRDAFLEIWPQLRVLARCTPADKFTIVQAVRSLTTDRVAMTGDGTNDGPALRAADVGFAMNSGTQVAKDAADIVLLDDNFQSIVVAALWGRNVYANVARFLQFQLTINVVAVIIAVGGALGASESPLSAVQMLWVNLIMDSLASLALATEAPHPTLLDIPPFSANHQFLNPGAPMLKHVVGQAVYQLAALVWLLVAAPAALGFPAHLPGEGPSIHHTLVFNAFVMMQLFNQLNARKVSDDSNVADGLSTANLFLGVLAAEAVLQLVIVQLGGEAFSTVALDPVQWSLCLGFGAGSLLVREALRKLPHETIVEWLNGSK